MSDYAKFVAAATRDYAIDGLLEENKNLKLRPSRLVTVTGKGGQPIYAQGSLDDAKVQENEPAYAGECVKTIILQNCTGENADSSLTMCPIQDVVDAEIRLAGVLVYVCGRSATSDVMGDEGELFTQQLYSFQAPTAESEDTNNVSSFVQLLVEYGPLPERFREEGADQGPSLHVNDEIAEVRFLDIQFHDQVKHDSSSTSD